MASPWKHAIRCPEKGEPLEEVSAWLWSDQAGLNLYPVLCKTPVLTANPDAFLLEESQAVTRAIAEFTEEPEVRQWFFSRYGRFHAADASTIDSEVLGEAYPGFWEQLPTPEMVKSLTKSPPEAQIMEWLGDRQFQLALDVGSGQGAMTQRMAERANWVWGLERQFYLAALANQLLPQAALAVGFHDPRKGWSRLELPKQPISHARSVCGDLHEPPFAPGIFDWVHCGHVLDLVEAPAEGLIALTRLLKPDGILTICSPLDFAEAGHFDELHQVLRIAFETLAEADGVPWLRFNHKRRYILHEDWLWMGQLRPEALKAIG